MIVYKEYRNLVRLDYNSTQKKTITLVPISELQTLAYAYKRTMN
jgi:hypothetical protein